MSTLEAYETGATCSVEQLKMRGPESGWAFGACQRSSPIYAMCNIMNKLFRQILRILNTHTHQHTHTHRGHWNVQSVSCRIFTSQALTISHPRQTRRAWATVSALSGANFAFPVCESVCVCDCVCVCVISSHNAALINEVE